VHSQPTVEAALELKEKHSFDPLEIEKIDVTTFLTAYHIVGGGEYGDRKTVYTKEAGDHSMPYVVAVALLDGQVYPEQLFPERINQPDVQELLQKVDVHTSFPLHKPVKLAGILDKNTEAYPDKLMTQVTIEMKNGEKFSVEKESYKGFFLIRLPGKMLSKNLKNLQGIEFLKQQKMRLSTLFKTSKGIL
jgi:2-methylcitrate dehydratase